jgi:hypothetical protein
MTDVDTQIANLCVVFNREFDDAIADLYTRALEDIPAPLLEAAVARAIRGRRFMPTVAELRQDAEACRQELSTRLPFVPCVACRSRWPGWIVVVDPAGVSRETRCDCWLAHQALLAGRGYTGTPVFRPGLPAAEFDEERPER